jgi:cytochrome bd-type quinol oxidase subunit 1
MAAILSVIVLGDESGYEMGDVQKTKLAAIEAEWETQPAPAAFTLFGIPDQKAQETASRFKSLTRWASLPPVLWISRLPA